MTTVTTINFDQVFEDITARLKADSKRRQGTPLVRLWDGDWNLRGTVKLENSASFQTIDNETGIGKLEMPARYYLSRWMTDHDARAGKKNIFITVDKDGARWSGALEDLEFVKADDGEKFVRAIFKHDYEHLKHIICYSNPFLPPEIQFPRLWIMFGPAKWALKLTLMLQIMRLESSLWALPDDPMNLANWFNFDQSTWSQVVKPLSIGNDFSQFAIVHSRFKNMHDVSKRIVADAQLSWEPRRYLDGDEPPWPGANLRHGCLVWDLVDKSGWDQETSFGGNLFSGLIRAFIGIGGDGMTEGVDVINDPTFPAEYSTPGFLGTIPRAPGIILRDGKHSGVQTASFHWKPATDVGVVTGGHSMPGVNELISAGIQMAGDLIAAMLFVPPIGGTVDAILKPLYTDVFLAFMKWKDIFRAQDLGWSHYHETWGDGADRAYTLSALIALRTGMWRTREQTSHTVTVADGVRNLRIGQNGYGNAYLGDRIGTTIDGWGKPGRVYVDRISELTLAWDRKTNPAWTITVGAREQVDPVAHAIEMLQDVMGIVRDLGVL